MTPEQRHMGAVASRQCISDGCDRKHYAKGFCTKHYQRLISKGDVSDPKKRLGCYVDGCDEEHSRKGLCSKHYHRLRKTGRFDVKVIVGNPQKRLMTNVSITESGCWEWNKYKKNGYGVTVLKGKQEQAHRASWKVFVGDIENGMQINHKCHNRACINPDHLYKGTQVENMRDMEGSGRANRARGERAGLSVLSVENVISIKKLIKQGSSNLQLSDQFNVAPTTISAIRNNKTWRNIQI